MLKQIFLTALCLSLSENAAQAAVCVDFKTCVTVMHELTGQRYIWGPNSDTTKIGASPNVELTKENAELVFTALLDQSGYARMPVGDGKTYRIERFSNRKELEMPILEASAEHMPDFPKTWDWVMMRYKLKSPELAPLLESNFRLHVPRESRLQADENTGIIMVVAATPVVRQMYETLKGADKPMSAAMREKVQASAKRWHEIEMARLKNPKKED